MARRLADGLSGAPGVAACGPPTATSCSCSSSPTTAEAWKAAGAQFYEAPSGDRVMVRLVTSFATTDEHVSTFLEVAQRSRAEDNS